MNVQDRLHGFTVTSVTPVAEVNGTVYELHHDKSGARLLYIATEDTNKVFHIAFRTPPTDNTGVAHILEHSVLCGSKKFPLKEPFVELVKGSLNTFLNAMTYPDKTIYPVASKNDKDFHNLMEVYLDAVFYPRVAYDPTIVMQEGWHYELDDKDADLTYKGVVYNEMKGVYSSPDSQLDRYKMKLLFPDNTYGKDSGGYPDEITDLTYENFQQFYQKFYHPSNSYIYLYGNMDIDASLKFINDEYLANFDAISVDSEIKLQAPLKEMAVASYPYGIGSDEDENNKAIHSMTYVMPELSLDKRLAFEVLTHTLFTSSAAPVKEALVAANIGSDINAAFVDSYRQPILEISATGSTMEKQAELAKVIESSLREQIEKGLDKESLEGSLNRIEFILREASFGGRPIGLAYGIRIMDNWLYDQNPVEALQYEGFLATVREGLKTDYFEKLIEELLLNNTHKALVSLYPQKGIQEAHDEEEHKRLQAYKASLSDTEVEKIVKETAELKKIQQTPDTEEALETIPLLELADLDPKVAPIDRRMETVDGVRVHFVPLDTRGISYVNGYFNIKNLTEEEFFYVELLSDLLGRLDTKNYSYADVSKNVNLHLGGLSMDIASPTVLNDRHAYVPMAVVRGKALSLNIRQLMHLMGEVINYTQYTDEKRLLDLLNESKAIWTTDAFRRGNTIVSNLIQAQVSEVGKLNDQDTLGFFKNLAALLKDEAKLKALPAKLAEVAKKVFRKDNLDMSFAGSLEEYDAFKEHLHAFIQGLSSDVDGEDRLKFTGTYKNEGIMTSGKVQYVGKGGNFRDYGMNHVGSMSVLETILRYEYLWSRVRVQGGAYGAFANFNNNGDMIFCSYRDPNLENTLDVYDGLPAYLRELELSDREMRKYIIGTMSGLDVSDLPSLKAARAMAEYFTGSNAAVKTNFRKEVIATKVEDLKALADVIEKVLNDNHVVVMGNEQKIKDAKDKFDELVTLPQ